MPTDTLHTAPLPGPGLRRLVPLLAALQVGLLLLAALAGALDRGTALASGVMLALILVPALVLARHEGRAHLAMALALLPLAALAALSVYLN